MPHELMNETYILGSGRSLLDLNEIEKKHIGRSDKVISFNKYLLFYEIAGIVPHVHIQFDAADKPSYYVFLKTIEKIIRDRKLQNVSLGLSAKLAAVARKCYPGINVFTIQDRMENWDKRDFRDHYWAADLQQKMFHFRGSFTSVLNYAHIIRPQNTIKLVGVDMNSEKYFFQDEYEKDRSFHDWTYTLMQEAGKHSNIIADAKFGNLSQEECISWARDKVRATGGDLVSSNAHSYYVEQNFLDFAPVCPPEEKLATYSCAEMSTSSEPLIDSPSLAYAKFWAVFRIKLRLWLLKISDPPR